MPTHHEPSADPAALAQPAAPAAPAAAEPAHAPALPRLRAARAAPPDDILQLQRQMGNRAVSALLGGAHRPPTPAAIQRVREGGEEDSRYALDEYGRPSGAASIVGRVEGIRNEEAQAYVSGRINVLLDTVFAGSGKEIYHASHLITRHHGGGGDTGNLVPTPRSYNTHIATKKSSSKLKEDGKPKFWQEQDERYSDFEGRVDQLVAQSNGILLTMRVRVGYGPRLQDQFLAEIMDKGSLSLLNQPCPQDVNEKAWAYALRALYRHIFRTLRTIPFIIEAEVAQGSTRLSNHISTARQLLQLDQPWTISNGFLNRLAKALAADKVSSPGHVNAVLSQLCGYTGGREELPQYFDDDSDRTAMVSGLKDYDIAVQELISQAPYPGIRQTYDNKGVAGGVDAFIWMDPKGTARYRYGGSQPSVSPKGVTWSILEAARPGAKSSSDRKKMYVRAHLLNHHVHGAGNDPENLVPFVDAANSRMEVAFESIVKDHPALYHQFTDDPDWQFDEGGAWVRSWYGILWQTRTLGKVVRPQNYSPLELANAMPGHPAAILAREEGKMPQAIDMKAYHARMVRKSRGAPWELIRGDLIVSHREMNSLDGGSVLEPTNSGTGLDTPSIGIAQRLARTRTFGTSSEELMKAAGNLLLKAGYMVGVDGKTMSVEHAKDKKRFKLTINPRGKRMADISITSAGKIDIDDQLDALGDEVRLLDLLESQIPVIDSGALAGDDGKPLDYYESRHIYAARQIRQIREALDRASKGDLKWSLTHYKKLSEGLNMIQMSFDLAELSSEDDTEQEAFQEEHVMQPLAELRKAVEKALSGTGVKLEDAPVSSGDSDMGMDFDEPPAPKVPKGSIDAGNGYALTPGQQQAMAQRRRANVPIAPNGDCLFASLIQMGAFQGSVKQFRDFVAGRVRNGAIDVRPFLLNPQITADEIATQGSYNNLAGDSTPSIIAQALGINLLIFNPDGSTTNVDSGGQRTFYLIRFLWPAAHYHATHSTMG